MKLTLICIGLVVVSVLSLWFALSLTDQSPQKGGAANPQAHATSRPAGAPNRPAGAITIAPNSPSADTGASMAGVRVQTNTSSCQGQCQTTHTACQAGCYRQYSVTNQTQDWNRCMQTCGSRLGVCGSDCIAGITPSPGALMAPPQLPGAQVAAPSLRSAPTPALPPAMPDQSSASSIQQ